MTTTTTLHDLLHDPIQLLVSQRILKR